MKLTVKGIPNRPVVVLIHPELCDWRFFDRICEQLNGRYRVALPTLSGHYSNGPDFVSVAAEAKRLRYLLNNSGIDRIHTLLGCGIGGHIGLEFLKDAALDEVRFAVFDSPTLTNSHAGRSTKLHEFRSIAHAARRDPEKALRRVDTRDTEYAKLIVSVAARMSETSLIALADACFDCPSLPELSAARQHTTDFIWGSYDPQCKSAAEVRKAYPYAAVDVSPGNPAYTAMMYHTEEYVHRYLS